MPTIVMTLSSAEIAALAARLGDEHRCAPGPYMDYRFRYDDCSISVYQSHRVVFQGPAAQRYASGIRQPEDQPGYPQCGSDEVGTGDFLGPVTVAASLVSAEAAPKLRALGVGDSKSISDPLIRKTAKELIRLIPYSLCVLGPEKFNQVHAANNMNAIKSKLHNQCYINLKKKTGALPRLRVIDQFTPEKNYYRYLAGQPEIITGITFRTKAEDQFLAVGASSIIARYAFLREMDKLSDHYGVEFPKGAGAAVDAFAAAFLARFGAAELAKVAKLSFSNATRLAL